MIDKAIFAKVFGCGTLATGAAGGGYYAHTKGAFNFEYSSGEKEEVKDYLIVKSVINNDPDLKENIYEKNILGNLTKNFKCTYEGKEDQDCEIYKLSEEEKKLSRLTINKNFLASTTSVKEGGNFFKLMIKKTDFFNNSLEWENENKLIKLQQKNVKENGKTFAKLIPVYKVEGGKITDGKKSSLIADVTSTDLTSISTYPTTAMNNTNKNYQCRIDEIMFDCEVSEITVSSDKKTVIFNDSATSSKTPVSNDVIKNKDKQFLVKAVKSYFENIQFNNKTEQKLDVLTKPLSENGKYSILTPKFVAVDKKVTHGKSNFSFAVLASGKPSKEEAAEWSTYKKCSVRNLNIEMDCSIYKFSTSPDSTTQLSALDFSGNLTTVAQDSDIVENKFFVIQFKPANKKFLDKDTEIKLISETLGKKEYTFTTKANMYLDSKLSGTTNSVNSVYIFE